MYVGATDDHVYAIDAGNGTLRWQMNTSAADQNTGAPPVSVASGAVYAGAMDHNVYALRAGDGSQLWRTLVGWYPTAPAVVNGVAYTASSDGVVALDAQTGSVRWSVPHISGWQPVVSNGTVYVASNGSGATNLYAFDASSGALRWTANAGSFITGIFSGSPVVADGMVFASAENGYVYAFNAATGAVAWRTQLITVVPGVSPLAVVNGIVYVGGGNQSNDYHLYALRTTDGTQIWSHKLDGTMGEPVVVGDVLYVGVTTFASGVSERWVYALHLADGSTIWRVDLAGALPGAPFWSRPLVVNGTLYIGSEDDHLYAVRTSDGSVIWRFQAGGAVGVPAYAA
jgi:outer membrane protein assembly factor BamB